MRTNEVSDVIRLLSPPLRNSFLLSFFFFLQPLLFLDLNYGLNASHGSVSPIPTYFSGNFLQLQSNWECHAELQSPIISLFTTSETFFLCFSSLAFSRQLIALHASPTKLTRFNNWWNKTIAKSFGWPSTTHTHTHALDTRWTFGGKRVRKSLHPVN